MSDDNSTTPVDWTVVVNAVVAAVTGSGSVVDLLNLTVQLDAAETAVAMQIMGNGWAQTMRAHGATDEDLKASVSAVLERTIAGEVERGLGSL